MTQTATVDESESASKGPVALVSADGEDPAFASLGASLAEIRKLEGVTGYILRGNASALLDLADNDRASQYALLSYQLGDSCLAISKQVGTAEIESAVAEGKRLKVLFMKIGENKISVFMEKGTSHVWIIKRILI